MRVLCACSVYSSLIVPVRESALECVRARACVLCHCACVAVLVRSVCSFRVSARACMGVRACICMRVRACICVRVRACVPWAAQGSVYPVALVRAALDGTYDSIGVL